MKTYKDLYLHVFNAITDALEDLSQGRTSDAVHTLETAQQQTEEWFIDSDIVSDQPLLPTQN